MKTSYEDEIRELEQHGWCLCVHDDLSSFLIKPSGRYISGELVYMFIAARKTVPEAYFCTYIVMRYGVSHYAHGPIVYPAGHYGPNAAAEVIEKDNAARCRYE